MSAIRPVVCSLFFCCLVVAAAGAAPAAESGAAFRLDVKAQAVDVLDADGRVVQSLPFDGETPDDDNREFFALVEDMNFDSFPDVRILFSRGMVNLFYDWWLWDPETQAFVRYDEARILSNPTFDPASKRIGVYERGSAISHASGELAWENGELLWLALTVQDEADDGEHIVIRRFVRGADGEMRLVEERTVLPEELEEEQGDGAELTPEAPGLNFALGLALEPMDAALLPDGEWWLWQGTSDRTLVAESRRLPPLEYGEDALRGLIRFGWPSAREIAIAPFPALSEKTSYPAFKAEFLVGENEDTRLFAAALVFTDEWSFWFVLSASANAELTREETGATDAAVLGEDLKRDLETLLLGVGAVDSFGLVFPSGSVPAVIIAGGDSPLPISVMDALIRIKKIVGPEHSRWVRQYGTAYRYEGPGVVGDKAALLFSFGANNADKYTAERHFAVDGAGTVYEMDVVGGGSYWEWDAEGVYWWGEYQRGDTVLHIGNYREGPGGMYFVFDFAEGGKEVFDGTASVRGRTASYGPLLFVISEGDMTVTVTVDPELAGEGEGDLSRLAGVYRAEPVGVEEEK